MDNFCCPLLCPLFRLFLCCSFRLFNSSLLHTFPNGVNIVLRGFDCFTAMPVKLMNCLMNHGISIAGNSVGGIFLRVALGYRNAVFCFILGTDIHLFHPISSYCCFVQSLDGTFYRIACLNLQHRYSPPQGRVQSALPQPPCGHCCDCIHR